MSRSTCLEALRDKRADVIFVAAEDPLQDVIFATTRAAFAVSFWGALAEGLAAERQDILASVLDLAGRRALLYKAHQPDAGFERHACRNLAHFAAHGLQLRRKLGITIDKALKPASFSRPENRGRDTYFKEPDTELQRCMESVRQQTLACDHILVSDGFPNPLSSNALVQPTSSSAGRMATTAIRPATLVAFLPSLLAMMRLPILTRTIGIIHANLDLLVRKQHETHSAAVCSWRNIYLPNGLKLPDIDEERPSAAGMWTRAAS